MSQNGDQYGPGHNSGFEDPDMQAVDDALHILRDLVIPVAEATAEFHYLSEMRKVVKAAIMGEHQNVPIGKAEMFAYTHPRYQRHLADLRRAEIEYLCRLGQRSVAEREIDVGRSKISTKRAAAKF